MSVNKSASNIRAPRLLITMPWGIGDAIDIGLSAVDQITQNDPGGNVIIDILCTHSQAPIFEPDPRIHAIIAVDENLFPSAAKGTWKRGLLLSPAALRLAKHLRRRHYTGVLPISFVPSFFCVLRAPLLFLNIREVWNVLTMLHTFQAFPLQKVVRQIINKSLGGIAEEPGNDEPIPLYLYPEHLQKARQYAAQRNMRAGLPQDYSPWLLVAPDTSSDISRPPTSLLAQGIAGALLSNPHLFVEILPGYTDTRAAHKLWQELEPCFPERIFLMPAEPRMHLLELAALIDQSDIFLTGDTCTMHLAAAVKMLPYAACPDLSPRNAVKIIALFGGTNPSLHGYSQRTTIIGKGRKEQATLTPGIAKEPYHTRGKDFFDHISSCQITSAILN